MARTNKYSSINFNEIYDKKINPNKSAAAANSSNSLAKSSLQHLSNSRIHGGMLVLTRPTPKPQPQIIPQQKPALSTPTQIPKTSDQPNLNGQDSISLRPGSTSTTSSQPISIAARNKEKEALSSSSSRSPSFSSSLSSPKPEPFVPPHLRPGFAGKQDRLVQEGNKINQGFRSRELGPNQGHSVGSPNQYGDNGRPKSGGYHRGGDLDQALMNRPSSSSSSSSANLNRPNSSGSRPNSSGNRPNSSGWYGSSSSSYRSPHHY